MMLRHTLALLLAVALMTGCTHPIGVKEVAPQRVYREANANVLGGQVSHATRLVIRRYELQGLFLDSTADALKALHDRACTDGRRDVLFALSELSYRYADDLARSSESWDLRSARDHYLASSIYAYLYLLGDGQEPRPSPFDERFRQACELYNNGLSLGLVSGEERGTAAFEGGSRALPRGAVTVQVAQLGLPWPIEDFDRFLPANQFLVHGLSTRDRQSGLGAPLIGITRRAGETTLPKRVPMTAFLRVTGDINDWTTGRLTAALELHSAYDEGFVTVGGQTIPLESDRTVAVAHALDQGMLWRLGASQFFSAKEIIASNVYPMQPYQPGRVPVVFVHGTFSSPVWWAEMWNTLRSDPVLRQRYQFWYFIYNSGSMVPLSAARLRHSLEARIREFDPEGRDPALRQMVVIGHSQGGLLTKMTVVDPGDQLWRSISDADFEALPIKEEHKAVLREGLFFKPVPAVKRVVFISTPHRGSFLATSLVRQLTSRLVSASQDLLRLQREAGGFWDAVRLPKGMRKGIPTSLDGMSPTNPLLNRLADMHPVPGVKSHSIIAVTGDGDPADGDDGVVKYSSAHIDYADSELIVRSDHSCQGRPVTIEEVRRILLEHLASLPAQSK